jgi:hypothetical protein
MRRWEDDIKMDLKGTGRENADWIHLLQDKYNRRVLVNAHSTKGGEFLDHVNGCQLLKKSSVPRSWAKGKSVVTQKTSTSRLPQATQQMSTAGQFSA